MAGKIISMSQLRQLLLLHEKKRGIKTIAKSLSISKNTVKVYLQKFEAGQWDIQALLELEDHELEKRFQAGNPAYADTRFEVFQGLLDYFIKELTRTDERVSRILLWEEYIAKHPQGYRYTQFCYHLDQHLKAKNPSMVLTHVPGERLFVDFAGRTRSYVNQATGEIIKCQLFVACLPSSDYGFVIAVHSQKIADFLYALTQCFLFLGGVPELLVPDNLKSAVIKASRYEPDINQALQQLANYYGIEVLPARPLKPKDKAKVEGFVNNLYGRILAPLRDQIFFSLAGLNAALFEYNNLFNQRRMQGRDYSRLEAFLANEKALLRPLTVPPFDLEYTHLATVQNNGHVKLSVDNHSYSVPFQYIGKQAKIVYKRTLVTIFIGYEKVATHSRNPIPGKYTFIKEHLASHHQHQMSRSPEYYIKQASKVSQVLEKYFEYIFSGEVHPELKYRTCDGLLSLQKQYREEKQHFETACLMAIEHEVRTYQFVREVLENKTYLIEDQAQSQASIPAHENIRGQQYYLDLDSNTTSSNDEPTHVPTPITASTSTQPDEQPAQREDI